MLRPREGADLSPGRGAGGAAPHRIADAVRRESRRPRRLRAAPTCCGLFVALLIVLLGAPSAPAANPGAFFETVSKYRSHSEAFKNGFAAGLYDAVSMFAATAQGAGLTNAGAEGLFQCLDKQATNLGVLANWVAQAAKSATDQTAVVAAIVKACGGTFSTNWFFAHVSDFKSNGQDYQQGFAGGVYDVVSQFAAAAQGPANLNGQNTVAAWKCLDGKGNKLGDLRSWIDTASAQGASDDAVRSIALAACRGTVADLSAPAATSGVPLAPWKTYWYIPVVIVVAAVFVYGLSRKKGTAMLGKAAAVVLHGSPQGPVQPGPVEKPQADVAASPAEVVVQNRPPDRREQQESQEQSRVPTGLWLWTPGRAPLGLDVGSQVSAEDLGDTRGATGMVDVAAVVEADPGALQRFRLRNRSDRTWRVREPGADWKEVAPGAATPMVPGTTMMVGEVRVNLHPWAVQPLRPAWQPRLRIGERLVPVAGDLQLHEYDLAGVTAKAGDGVVARVSLRSADDTILGLQNLSTTTWVATPPDSGPKEIEPGRSIRLRPGMRIVCGTATIDVE